MACINRNTKEYQDILNDVKDPLKADYLYIYDNRSTKVFRNDENEARLITVEGSLGNAIYLTDNEEYSQSFGTTRSNYFIDNDDIIDVGNDTGFLKEVMKYHNINKISEITSKLKQDYLDYNFSKGKIIKVNRYNKTNPKTNYLIGSTINIYNSPNVIKSTEDKIIKKILKGKNNISNNSLQEGLDWFKAVNQNVQPKIVQELIDGIAKESISKQAENAVYSGNTNIFGIKNYLKTESIEIQKLVKNVLTNYANRANMSLTLLQKRIRVIKTNQEVNVVANSLITNQLDNSLNINFNNNNKSEILFQSENQINTILQKIPSLNKTNDKTLIEALGLSKSFLKSLENPDKSINEDLRKYNNQLQSQLQELFKNNKGNTQEAIDLKEEIQDVKKELKEIETFKTFSKEEVLNILRNELNEIVNKAKNTNDYYIQDFSDIYLKSEIKRYKKLGLQKMSDNYKYLLGNKNSNEYSKEIEAQQNIQKENLLNGLNYLVGNNDYTTEFQFLMVYYTLNNNFSILSKKKKDENGVEIEDEFEETNPEDVVYYLSSRNENTVGLHNELSSAILPIVQEEYKNSLLNPLEIYKNNRNKSFLSLSDRELIAKKYIVEKRPNGYWLKISQNTSEEGILDLHLLAKETHKNSPDGSWCTGATLCTAKSHNSQGDFYIFVDNAFNTRIAMKYTGSELAESRGLGKGQLILKQDLEESLYFYNKYPNALKFKKTVSFNLLYNKYENNNILEEKDIEELINIHNNGDGSYNSNESDKKKYLLLQLLKNNIDKISKHLNILEENIGFKNDNNYINNIKNNKYKYFIGNLNLSSLITAEGLVLPTTTGTLNLSSLKTAKGLVLPTTTGNLYLNSLKTAKGLVLPTTTGYLDLSSLKTAEGLVLPTTTGSLYLSSLKTAEGLVLPTTTGTLNLSSLITAKGLVLPTTTGDLDLRSLTTTKGLVLPTTTGDLYLSSLKTAEGLVLPTTTGSLYLNSLTTAKGLVLPTTTGTLYLSSLITAEGLVLPTTIGNLYLNSLTTAKGLVLPTTTEYLNLSSLKTAKGLVLPTTTRDLDLRSLTTVEGLVLPTTTGYLDLSSLKTAKGLVLPTTTGTLNLSSLITAEGLVLPTTTGDLYLGSLKTTKGLVLPTTTGTLNLSSLKTAKGLVLPTTTGTLNLSSLKTAKGLVLPTTTGYLYLNSLKTAKGLVLPTTTGTLNLSSLITAKGLVLPTTTRDLDLKSLTTVEGLVLPTTTGYLDLSSLKTAEGLVLPTTTGSLYLNSLITAEGLVLPTTTGTLDLSSLTTAEGLTVAINSNINDEIILTNADFLRAITLNKVIINKNILDINKINIQILNSIKILNQGKKAAIVLTKSEFDYIILGKESNPISLIHELAHKYEQVLTKNEIKILEDWSGAKQNSIKFKEMFAKGAEKYIYENLADTKELKTIFQKLAEWFKNIIGSYFNDVNEFNPAVKEIYALMFNENINNLNTKNSIQKTKVFVNKTINVNNNLSSIIYNTLQNVLNSDLYQINNDNTLTLYNEEDLFTVNESSQDILRLEYIEQVLSIDNTVSSTFKIILNSKFLKKLIETENSNSKELSAFMNNDYENFINNENSNKEYNFKCK